jgi:hypothetical protein
MIACLGSLKKIKIKEPTGPGYFKNLKRGMVFTKELIKNMQFDGRLFDFIKKPKNRG